MVMFIGIVVVDMYDDGCVICCVGDVGVVW